MNLRLLRTNPEVADYSEQELAALKARRAAQNERVIALTTGERDSVPLYDTVPAIPGVANPAAVTDENFAAPLRAWNPWEAETYLDGAITSAHNQIRQLVKDEVERLHKWHHIVIAPNTIPGLTEDGLNLRKQFRDEVAECRAAIDAAATAGECLWYNYSASRLAGYAQYLKSIGKTFDYLNEEI